MRASRHLIKPANQIALHQHSAISAGGLSTPSARSSGGVWVRSSGGRTSQVLGHLWLQVVVISGCLCGDSIPDAYPGDGVSSISYATDSLLHWYTSLKRIGESCDPILLHREFIEDVAHSLSFVDRDHRMTVTAFTLQTVPVIGVQLYSAAHFSRTECDYGAPNSSDTIDSQLLSALCSPHVSRTEGLLDLTSHAEGPGDDNIQLIQDVIGHNLLILALCPN